MNRLLVLTHILIFLFSAAGTDSHEFHHSINMGMYGHKLALWDHVFGTDTVYKQWRMKQWERTKKV